MVVNPRTRSSQLIVKDLGDDVVVFDEVTSEVHHLNPAAALVWRQCSGRNSVTDLARILGANSGLPVDEGVVSLAIADLERVGLLETSGGEADAGISRRQLAVRLGSAAAIWLPAIVTLIAPTPAMALSTPSSTPSPTPAPTPAPINSCEPFCGGF